MKLKNMTIVLIAVLVAGGLLAGYWLKPPPSPQAEELVIDTFCDVTTDRCAIEGKGKAAALNLTLELGPNPAVMEPFTVTLTDWGDEELQLDDAIISFSMVGMDMGLNRYRLEAQGDGVWQGQATLPVCAAGRRDWQADLRLTTAAGEHYQVQALFVTR